MRKFEAIRNEIKKLSDLQREYKPQRKENYHTNKSAGVTPFGATNIVKENKYELRHLFQAYAILKGIDRPIVKKPSNFNGNILDEGFVSTYVKKFTPVIELEEV